MPAQKLNSAVQEGIVSGRSYTTPYCNGPDCIYSGERLLAMDREARWVQQLEKKLNLFLMLGGM